MQSLRDLKRRIRSVKNIGQITKAMEVVSMTKMRRSQAFALDARPYSIAAFEMFLNLLTMAPEQSGLLQARPDTKKLLAVVTSDKGLAGAFNENVLRMANRWIEDRKKEGKEYALLVVGRKAKDAFERRGEPIVESFTGFGDYSTLEETEPVAKRIVGGFVAGEWSGADIAFTHFRSTLKQEAVLRQVLPATKEALEEAVRAIVPESGKYHELAEEEIAETDGYSHEFIFEPSPKEILDELIPELLKIRIHHAILESNASEHSARMVAMKSASDNARELSGELNLDYNKARQSGITAELAEVVAGQASVE
ncbi:MAG TPA: ATP synthase F1 subunit gamma [Candidatus Paceibacterota bacterium]|nr:ATP synthase F1 subunit gamma [Candidatus Paceibacterota bacterium]